MWHIVNQIWCGIWRDNSCQFINCQWSKFPQHPFICQSFYLLSQFINLISQSINCQWFKSPHRPVIPKSTFIVSNIAIKRNFLLIRGLFTKILNLKHCPLLHSEAETRYLKSQRKLSMQEIHQTKLWPWLWLQVQSTKSGCNLLNSVLTQRTAVC